MTHRAATDQPVHELLAARWSPYAFADRAVAKEDLLSLFEAARWAPSSYNEQPWSYLVATREEPEEHARLLSCLVEGNQAWAKAAPVLALGCTSLNFVRNGQPNAAAAERRLDRDRAEQKPRALADADRRQPHGADEQGTDPRREG